MAFSWFGNKKKKRKPRKKKMGLIKGAAHAVSSEILRGTGYIGDHLKKKIQEDGMGGVGGTPVNSASSGAIAGLGTSKDGSQGEPGVNKKRKKTPLLSYTQFKRNMP